MEHILYGKKEEALASNYLERKGYTILQRNYRNKVGEIDIIAKDKDYLVFIEVKARVSRQYGDPLEAITPWKQNKIRRVAELYLIETKQTECRCRFDAIAVLGSHDEDIRHIVNAF